VTYKEKIIKFMQEKNKIIKKHTGIIYFNEKDKNDILSWSEKDCKNIYLKILDHVTQKYVFGMGWVVCPYCIKYLSPDKFNCHRCEYAKNHGECLSTDSVWNKVSNWRSKPGKRIYDIMDDKFYDNLIKKIEGNK